MGIILSITIVVLFLSFAVVEFITVYCWRGVWRRLALLAGLAIVIIILNIFIGILLDPTSHNLWPLEILVWSFGALVYLGVLFLIRKIITRQSSGG